MRDTIRSALYVLAAAVLLVTGGCAWNPLPPGATEQAREMHDVWSTMFITGVVVFVAVLGLIVWCVVRYRARPGGEASWPEQFRRNDRAAVAYILIPFLLVIGLFVVVDRAERRVEALPGNETLRVDVTGYRWSWRFAYPSYGVTVDGTPDHPPEFELPVGETTRLDVGSADVDHSFWVPEFLFKRDAIPGLRNEFDWTPTRVGVFRGECGEFCGLQHALMLFSVRVVTRPEFDAWIAGRRRSGAGA